MDTRPTDLSVPSRLHSLFAYVGNNFVVRNLRDGWRVVRRDRLATFYMLLLVSILLLGVFGPYLAPYEHNDPMYDDEGSLLLTAEPSGDHLLGTTDSGYDIFSRLLYGARPTIIAGLLGGTVIVTIGTAIGVTAGYVGGRVDDLLMRFTDLMYSIPAIPFAIVLVALLGTGFYMSILIIGLMLWRSSARVLRSQTLQVKERPFVLAAKATGAGPLRIVFKHLLPNIAPMALLFFALGIGYTIIAQAGLAFLGVTSPFVPSWGIMIRNAYDSGLMDTAWWWSIPPGVMIALTVVSTFMFGRRYDTLVNEQTNESLIATG